MSAAVRAELEAKRAELAEQLAGLSASTGDTGGISFGKRVGEGTSFAVERLSQVAAHDRLGAVHAEVLRALARLDAGTYGRCDVCGEPIAASRLEARPWSTRCIQHAR